MQKIIYTKSVIAVLLLLLVGDAQAQIFGSSGITTRNVNAVQALKRYQRYADQAYRAEDYKRAVRSYSELAKYGDKYAQYRLAKMYAEGLGVKSSLIEAYAWSYVSAESRRSQYVKFHKNIRAQLDEPSLAKARVLAGERVATVGNYSVAVRAKRELRRQKGECTGSRVGNTCDRVTGPATTCNGFNGSKPSRSCFIIGAIGLTSIIGQLPGDIRTAERSLNNFIREYDPGRVELGDFELIDD